MINFKWTATFIHVSIKNTYFSIVQNELFNVSFKWDIVVSASNLETCNARNFTLKSVQNRWVLAVSLHIIPLHGAASRPQRRILAFSSEFSSSSSDRRSIPRVAASVWVARPYQRITSRNCHSLQTISQVAIGWEIVEPSCASGDSRFRRLTI